MTNFKKEWDRLMKIMNEGTPEESAKASVEFARLNGVPEERILHNRQETIAFFMGK